MLACRTVVWTAGVKPHPVVARLGLPLDRGGRILVDRQMRVEGLDGVWAIGDAAAVPRSFAHRAGRPSSVVIALPLTAATGVTQLRISFPSSSTEQAPHCASPQPKRGPCRCSSLCSTYNSGVSSDAVTE